MTLYKAPDTSSIDRELDCLDTEIKGLQALRKEAHRRRQDLLLEAFEALPEVAVGRWSAVRGIRQDSYRLIRWSKASIWLTRCADVCASNPQGAGIRFRRDTGREFGCSYQTPRRITDLAAVEALIAAAEGRS